MATAPPTVRSAHNPAQATGCPANCPILQEGSRSMVCTRRRSQICRAEVSDLLMRNLDDPLNPPPGLFNIALQPIVDLMSEAVIGYEALARFPLTDHPTSFWFWVAGRYGLTVELELALIRGALDHLHRLPGTAYLALNASPQTMTDRRLATLLMPCADRIVLELTEHQPVHDYAALRDAIAPLRAAGLRLAVDDVGAGFASFRHLGELTPDIMKIDMAFIHDLPAHPAYGALLESFVSLALRMGATLVAEGVETAAERDALRHLAVPAAQGYLFGRPEICLAA